MKLKPYAHFVNIIICIVLFGIMACTSTNNPPPKGIPPITSTQHVNIQTHTSADKNVYTTTVKLSFIVNNEVGTVLDVDPIVYTTTLNDKSIEVKWNEKNLLPTLYTVIENGKSVDYIFTEINSTEHFSLWSIARIDNDIVTVTPLLTAKQLNVKVIQISE